jgi:anthranilate synthase component 1
MAAGLFGYLGYDTVRLMERLPSPNPDPLGLPDAILVRPTVMVVFDAVRDEIWLITPVRPRAGVTARQAFESALERLEAVEERFSARSLVDGRSAVGPRRALAALEHAGEEYLAMTAGRKEYIAAGDAFQVVLSQRFRGPRSPLPPLRCTARCGASTPRRSSATLISRTFPDRLFEPRDPRPVRDGTVTVRPIAGTRPRGATPAEDRALGDELLADPKERAEHLMLLDLGRNDVGRVAQLGSVAVTDSFFLERYSQVMHIVSNVEGRIDPRRDALDALIAGFPAGTVTGAPKVRAMEIIDELEREKRGPYGGCIGYFGANGEMDTCIVLRTAIVKDGRMSVQAAPASWPIRTRPAEQQECVNKAKALFRRREEAVRFAARSQRGQ